MRKAYIEQQRNQHGRRALAVLPIQYPKEILTALDILAVEVWGPPGPPRGPDAGRVQAYVCAVARNALAFLASAGAACVDGALFPHTCDSIQGLATLAPDFGGWNKPAFRFIHPRGPDRPSARAFVEAELRSLAAELEALSGNRLRGNDVAWTNGLAPPLGQWTHLVATYDGAVKRMYLNGVLRFEVSEANGIRSSSRPLCIGAYADNVCDQGWRFFGSIDSLGVWNRALSPAEAAIRKDSSPTEGAEGQILWLPFDEWSGGVTAETVSGSLVSLMNSQCGADALDWTER